MNRKGIALVLLLWLAALPAAAGGPAPDAAPDGVESLVWERQNWEVNGGFERLTLWSDGRSEIRVAPLRYAHDDQENLRPKKGWKLVRYKNPRHVEFVRTDVYPPDTVRAKIRAALEAGIQLLEPFRPGYLDGGGTRIVIHVKGRQREIVMPYFGDREKGTPNYRRFLAVSAVLGTFDTSAYEVVPK